MGAVPMPAATSSPMGKKQIPIRAAIIKAVFSINGGFSLKQI